MRRTLVALALLAVALPVSAQQHAHAHAGGQFPAGWQGRVDRENQQLTDVQLMQMGSGFHVITGPHVILWNPERTATGAYTASTTFRLDRVPERREGYGMFVGGRDLDAPNQDYLYFLARHDGSYMIRHRAGTEVHTLADWTEHAAVNRPAEGAPATNKLSIAASATEVRFLINDQVVQTIQRVPMLNTDGVVGLRVGHHMDVHVPAIVIEPSR